MRGLHTPEAPALAAVAERLDRIVADETARFVTSAMEPARLPEVDVGRLAPREAGERARPERPAPTAPSARDRDTAPAPSASPRAAQDFELAL